MTSPENDLVRQIRDALALLATALAVVVAWAGIGFFLTAELGQPQVSLADQLVDFQRALEVYEAYEAYETFPAITRPATEQDLRDLGSGCPSGLGLRAVGVLQRADAHTLGPSPSEILFGFAVGSPDCDSAEEIVAAIALEKGMDFRWIVLVRNTGQYKAVNVRVDMYPSAWIPTACPDSTTPSAKTVVVLPGASHRFCFAEPLHSASVDPLSLEGIQPPFREGGVLGAIYEPAPPQVAVDYDTMASRAQDATTAKTLAQGVFWIWALFMFAYVVYRLWGRRPWRVRYTFSDWDEVADTGPKTPVESVAPETQSAPSPESADP